MTIALILSSLLISIHSFAAIQGLFGADKGIVIIQGQDLDAKRLYDSMNVEAVEDGNKLKKHIAHMTMYAEDVFDLTCNASKLNETLVSCTLKVSPSSQSIVNKDKRYLLVGINDQYDAKEVAQGFNHTGGTYQGEVFQSDDTRLHIWKTYDSQGDVVSFTIDFDEKG